MNTYLLNKKILFITPKCSHYHIGFFEEFSKITKVKFLFDTGEKKKSNPLLKGYSGNFYSEYIKSIKFFNNVIIINFYKLIKEIFNHDIIIKSDENQINIILIFLISKIFKKKIIIWCSLWKDQNLFLSRIKTILQYFYLKGADAIICYGTHVKEYILNKYKFLDKKIFIEHHSTNPMLYLDESINFNIRVKNKMNILFVGRLSIEKGLDYLIKAFYYSTSLAHLHIVGNGPLEIKLKKIVSDLKIENKVTFYGFIKPEALHNFYKQSDIFILPSISTPWITETWGYVINEALHYQLPVIATTSVGAVAGGLIVNYFNGLIVEEKNVFSIKEAIDELCNNKNLYYTLKNNTKKRLCEWNNIQMSLDFVHAIKSIL
ncbi:MAG: glycosyltransferase family 4 protein [Melioribacteraceae bacterium]